MELGTSNLRGAGEALTPQKRDSGATAMENGLADVRKCQVFRTDDGAPQSASEIPEFVLDASQAQAVKLLASGCTAEFVAKKVGVCERTIYRWKQDEHFRAALKQVARIRDHEVQKTARRALAHALGRVVNSMHDGYGVVAADQLLRNRHLWRLAGWDERVQI